MSNVSFIGAGSWGTALALLLNNNGHQVTIWSHRQSQVEMMRDEHKSDKLEGIILPENICYTSDLEVALSNASVVIMSVPSKATRDIALKMKPFVADNQIIVTVTKGIEENTLLTQSEILEEVFGNPQRIAVLSGPSHAEEVVINKPTVVVAGSKDRITAEFIQNLFMNDFFRVYTSPDIKGIEIGAALKNVIALAAGMSDGLGYGDNAKAALITRGIKEISALAVAAGGSIETLSGLTGVGDLIVTCSSKHSRNRMAGYYLGQGYSTEEAMNKVSMIVEGVYSAKAALKLAQSYNIDMPIVEQVNNVLFNNVSAKTAVYDLMTRSRKAELSVLEW